MPPPVARLRRHLGRLLAPGGTGFPPRSPGGGTQSGPSLVVVPLTVRTRTADGADIRLLLEAQLTSTRLPATEVERVALALVVPAAAAWVRRRELNALAAGVGPSLTDVADAVREQLVALGADLVAIEPVAVEHLLSSPTDVIDGPG